MATVFSDGALWQHAEFKFTVVGDKTDEIDARGNPIVNKQEISVLFKMRPTSRNRQELATVEQGDMLNTRYDCRVVAVDKNFEITELPTSIKPGDVGIGTIRDRPCRAVVATISQSSLINILAPILGEYIRLDIDYSVNRTS